MNIWKEDPDSSQKTIANDMRSVKLEELNLSVRSFNSLKRAGCSTVGDIIDAMGEDGDGLRRIRNLGARSEAEIKEKLDLLHLEYASRPAARRVYDATQECRSARRLDNRYSEATEIMELTSREIIFPGQESAGMWNQAFLDQDSDDTRAGGRTVSGQDSDGARHGGISDLGGDGARHGGISNLGGDGMGYRIILRPARMLWNREIGEFHLSHYAEDRLRSCGINRLKDLYATHPKNEPGWYAVRELFRKIAEFV